MKSDWHMFKAEWSSILGNHGIVVRAKSSGHVREIVENFETFTVHNLTIIDLEK